MTIILARLDLEEIYCDIDDFYQIWAQFVEFLPLRGDKQVKSLASKG